MTRGLTIKLLALSFCISSLLCQTATQARTLTIGTESSSSFNPPQPVFSPEPVIPEHLHEQCFKSCCIAKFLVKANGNTSVQLISTSGSDEVDELTLETLRRWRFKPATLDGTPVEGSKKVQVEFKVEQ